jgi:hypothetical protein
MKEPMERPTAQEMYRSLVLRRKYGQATITREKRELPGYSCRTLKFPNPPLEFLNHIHLIKVLLLTILQVLLHLPQIPF